MNDTRTPADSLTLPMPRWPFLWPLLAVLMYASNGAFQVARNWHGRPWQLAVSLDVRLGRGARAETIARWLVAKGLPEPVGR